MPSPSTAAKRVTLFVTRGGAQPMFTPTAAAGELKPHLLDADNLREAAVLTSRLRQEPDASTPLPLLRIDTTGKPEAANQSAIPFPASPRLLAGLIADAMTTGVADGAVIRIADNPSIPHQLRAEVAAHLEQADFTVSFYIPGWVLEDEDGLRSAG
ncbi:hypothetical protein [Rhodococcus opacus]|uniref:hypothetical protein n=1 Tax=Rhodococcus opacus TaxID=37919 RepID=UPI00155A47C0|nr:hypothetical protein [Rhodococcus opacus]